MPAPLPVPVVVFDGDCAICTTLAGFVERRVRRRESDFLVAPWQRLDLEDLRLTQAQCEEALQWVEPDRSRAAAQDAVAKVLLRGRLWWRPLGALLLAPGINQFAAVVYRWVADNRHRLPGGTPACSLPAAERPPAA